MMKAVMFIIIWCSLSLIHAKEPAVVKTDFIRVAHAEENAKLQTANTTYEKEGASVTLIGAIHIADQAYYGALNEEFKKYDRLLYEMIGGENLAAFQKQKKKQEKQKFLTRAYGAVAKFLKLTDQKSQIDYSPENFVHADLSLKEFQTLQKARDESILKFALQAGKETQTESSGDFSKIMKGLLTGNSNIVKRELIESLGQGDDQIGALSGESVIITDRNAKCLEVLTRELKAGHKNCAIFYGAAHFPDMEASLLKLGFKKTKQRWMTAWNVPKE